MSSLPPIFPLKIHLLSHLLRRPDAGGSLLPQDLRTPIKELRRFQRSKAPVTECSWSPQPNTFLVDTQIVNTVPRPSGVAGIFGQEIEQVLVIHNSALESLSTSSGGPHPLITLVTQYHLHVCSRIESPSCRHRLRLSPIGSPVSTHAHLRRHGPWPLCQD